MRPRQEQSVPLPSGCAPKRPAVMPDSNVSSCVLNILGSFSSSLALFKKLKDKRRKKKWARRDKTAEHEERRLSRSLRQGPEDIGQEYQNNIFAAGDQFAIGDAIAQTSLAEILLRLNVGLVGIITSFVNSDKNDVHLDYHGLTELSERSRIDTCRTLRQLFKRMTQLKPPLAITAKEDVSAVRSRSDKPTRKPKKAANGYSKVRGPMIAQVVIKDSSKPPQIAMVKPGERRKKSHSSTGSGSSSLSKASSEPSLLSQLPTPPPQYTPYEPPRPGANRSRTAPDAPKHRRKHSAGNERIPPLPPREDLRAAMSTPHLDSTLQRLDDPLPPMPNSAPLASTLNPPPLPRRRKPTPTYYSIASDSTKLGEIPMHKWSTPYDFDQMSILNREALQNGWPANQMQERDKRRRFGLFRLFGRRSE